MSVQITTAFVEQYRNNVELLVQQRGSKLRDLVNTDTAIVGKQKFTEQIGSTVPHQRRAYSMADYEWGDLVDKQDKLRMLIDPTSTYAQAAAFAMGRAMDDVIIAAATGTAFGGVDGTTDFTLPIGKLRRTLEIFQENNVPEDEEKILVVSPNQIHALLTRKETTSGDFNAIRALVAGELDTFYGFRIVMSNRLAKSGNNRTCFAFVRSGMELGIGQDVMARIEERADKAFSTYIYYCMTIGASRLEEEKVVEITCDESDFGGGDAATV